MQPKRAGDHTVQAVGVVDAIPPPTYNNTGAMSSGLVYKASPLERNQGIGPGKR